jgi:phage terminase small subunit
VALTTKQQAFVEAYLSNGFNATQAALSAGYSEKTAYSIASENLRKPEIAEAIQQRIAALTMSADEALMRLSDHARGTMEDFIAIKGGLPFIDLNRAAERQQLHLLKKFKVTDKGVEIELYDAQSALVHVLREQHLKSGEATERLEIDDNLSDTERAARIAAILEVNLEADDADGG